LPAVHLKSVGSRKEETIKNDFLLAKQHYLVDLTAAHAEVHEQATTGSTAKIMLTPEGEVLPLILPALGGQ
jgi:hypothetical protein